MGISLITWFLFLFFRCYLFVFFKSNTFRVPKSKIIYRNTKCCLSVPRSPLHLQPLLLISCESFQTVPVFHEQMWKYILFLHVYINTCLPCSVLWIFAEYGLGIFTDWNIKDMYFWNSLIFFCIDGHCLLVGTQVVCNHLLLQTVTAVKNLYT